MQIWEHWKLVVHNSSMCEVLLNEAVKSGFCMCQKWSFCCCAILIFVLYCLYCFFYWERDALAPLPIYRYTEFWHANVSMYVILLLFLFVMFNGSERNTRFPQIVWFFLFLFCHRIPKVSTSYNLLLWPFQLIDYFFSIWGQKWYNTYFCFRV